MALTEKLVAIGNAIREKNGTTEAMTLDAMAEAIKGIETGGSAKPQVVANSEISAIMLPVTIPSADADIKINIVADSTARLEE